MYVGICNTLLSRLGDVVSYSGNAKDSIFISFFCYISETILIGFAKIVIRPHFIFVGLTFDTFSSIPLVALYSHSKYPIRWELFLTEIHSFSKFIIFFIKIILKVAFDKYCLWHLFAFSFRSHYLPHFVMDRIFLNFTEPKISWINRPVIRSFFLLSRIIILVRLQIHSPHLFGFRHIFSRVDCLLCSPFVNLSWKSKFKISLFGWLRKIIVSIDSSSKRLPFETIIFAFHDFVNKLSNSSFITQLHDIVNTFRFFSGDTISILLWR